MKTAQVGQDGQVQVARLPDENTMQAYDVTIRVPYDVFINLHKSRVETAEDIRRQAAIRYYKTRTLSLGKAAELANMTRFEFIDYLRFNGEAIFDYTDEELDDMQQDALILAKVCS